MKKIATIAFASAAALALSACGSSDKASEEAQAENVELPAEEAVNAADANATPVADASMAGDAAAAASEAGAAASDAAESATMTAEKKTDAAKQ